MDRKNDEKRNGARKKATAAAQPSPADDAAKPASSAAKGRGRKQEPSSEGPGKAEKSLSNEGDGSDQREKESAPKGRKTSLKNNRAPKEEKCDPARKSNHPTEDKVALAKKPARLCLEAKELQPEKAEAASGAVPRKRNQVSGGEEKDVPLPRGKRASQKERAPAPKQPDPRRAEAAAVAALPRAPPGPPARSLRQVLQMLTLRMEEIGEAAKQVNAVMTLVENALKKKGCFEKLERLNTGSYYEHLKITAPDEFDIIFKVPDVRAELQPYDDGDCKGVFKFVKLKRNQKLKDFADDQHLLSTSKIFSEVRTIIIKEVKTINEMKVTVEKKTPGSPAVTLQIGEPPSCISVDIILALEMLSQTLGEIRKGGPGIKNWLGIEKQKELDKMKLWLVPKNAKDGAHFKDTWRLSFSLAEKNIIKYHGNNRTCCQKDGRKCCRKDCLKLLKYLLNQLKTKHQNRNQFNKFCSYHAKTAFFHTCTKWISDEEWLPTNIDNCFERLVDYFLDCLKKAELKHFFIPECNLFYTGMKCGILAKAIDSERINGYPIFEQT